MLANGSWATDVGNPVATNDQIPVPQCTQSSPCNQTFQVPRDFYTDAIRLELLVNSGELLNALSDLSVTVSRGAVAGDQSVNEILPLVGKWVPPQGQVSQITKAVDFFSPRPAQLFLELGEVYTIFFSCQHPIKWLKSNDLSHQSLLSGPVQSPRYAFSFFTRPFGCTLPSLGFSRVCDSMYTN